MCDSGADTSASIGSKSGPSVGREYALAKAVVGGSLIVGALIRTMIVPRR